MEIKEIAETAAYVVATIAAPITALWALLQWREALHQRKLEFRWRQADLGRQLLDQLFDEPVAGVALELIDGELDFIDIPDGGKVAVEADAIQKALSIPQENSPGSRQIRRAFDALLYYFDRFEAMITLNLIERDDIATPTAYYCMKLKSYTHVVAPYASMAGYDKALALIRAFQNTKQDGCT